MADLGLSCLVVARLLLLLNSHSLAQICYTRVNWIDFTPIKSVIFVAASSTMHSQTTKILLIIQHNQNYKQDVNESKGEQNLKGQKTLFQHISQIKDHRRSYRLLFTALIGCTATTK